MRLGLVGLVLVLASGGASVQAQGNPLGQLSFSRAQLLPTLRTYDFARRDLARSDAAQLSLTCPMPVFRSGSAEEDPMPVARGGPTEPMPVARSGCWNPLDLPSQSSVLIERDSLPKIKRQW